MSMHYLIKMWVTISVLFCHMALKLECSFHDNCHVIHRILYIYIYVKKETKNPLRCRLQRFLYAICKYQIKTFQKLLLFSIV